MWTGSRVTRCLHHPASGGFLCRLLMATSLQHLLWLSCALWPSLPLPFKDYCDYIGPTQKIQKFITIPTLNLITFGNVFCHGRSYWQVWGLRCRCWGVGYCYVYRRLLWSTRYQQMQWRLRLDKHSNTGSCPLGIMLPPCAKSMLSWQRHHWMGHTVPRALAHSPSYEGGCLGLYNPNYIVRYGHEWPQERSAGIPGSRWRVLNK